MGDVSVQVTAGDTPVRNALPLLVRSAVRSARASTVLTVVPAGLLLLGAGEASAADTDTIVQAESTTITFGLLGPVGVVAIALGIVGMTAGVVRQHRRAKAVVVETTTATDSGVIGMAGAVLAEDPTNPAMSPTPRP
jgi:hypothetical protein